MWERKKDGKRIERNLGGIIVRAYSTYPRAFIENERGKRQWETEEENLNITD